MLRILIYTFSSFILSCSVFNRDKINVNNQIIEFSSLKNCAGRGGGFTNFKSIKKDITLVVKKTSNSKNDTVSYKTDPNKWEELNSLIDLNEFKNEMKSVGYNNHAFDGCNKTFTVKTPDSTFVKYNSKITSDKLKYFYELYDKM